MADDQHHNSSSSNSSASSSGNSSSLPPPVPASLPVVAVAPAPPFAPTSLSATATAIATAVPLPQQQLLQQFQHQLHQQQRLLSLHLSSASSPPGTGGCPLPLKHPLLPPPTAPALHSEPAHAAAPVAAAAASDRHSRDDCWSENATLTLIHAWGDRYLELNRGNLKQKHWKDVADSVNRRASVSKAPKTDVQCKNRLDTLKKKYKLEKSKIVTGGGPSKWTFFDRLDELIGPSKKPKKPTPVKLRLSPPPPPGPLLAISAKPPVDEVEQKPQPPLPPPIFNNSATPAINHFTNNHVGSAADTASKSKESPDMTGSCPNGRAADGKGLKRKRSHDNPLKDLARAIVKFGEVYERIEMAKQQQMIELEKQRMEFTKDLELQRLQLFMQTQVEMAKLKNRSKHNNAEHYL